MTRRACFPDLPQGSQCPCWVQAVSALTAFFQLTHHVGVPCCLWHVGAPPTQMLFRVDPQAWLWNCFWRASVWVGQVCVWPAQLQRPRPLHLLGSFRPGASFLPAPNGPPGHATLRPGRQSGGRAELAPTHVKTRAEAGRGGSRGAGCMGGCRRGGGPSAPAHRCTASSAARPLLCQLVFNTRLSRAVIAS
uniref:Uncharacterized protein n=1 Tax=Pipistrellus kuhlii TaxID=59472 RepID=A0A7J7UGI4_PIPKU|nr:hypothetical protein mPipKuh1_009095 [Pipistrellus kuhlii]